MGTVVQVRLAGFGGQGIVLMGVILGQAGALVGKHVAGSNSYGAQARGSSCTSEVILSDGRIDFPHVITADVLVVLSQGAYATYRTNVRDSGLILLDKTHVKPDEPQRVRHLGIASSDYALTRLGNVQAASIVMLGALVSLTGIVPDDAVRKAIDMHVGKAFQEINLAALSVGMELAKGIDDG